MTGTFSKSMLAGGSQIKPYNMTATQQIKMQQMAQQYAMPQQTPPKYKNMKLIYPEEFKVGAVVITSDSNVEYTGHYIKIDSDSYTVTLTCEPDYKYQVEKLRQEIMKKQKELDIVKQEYEAKQKSWVHPPIGDPWRDYNNQKEMDQLKKYLSESLVKTSPWIEKL